MPSANDPTQAPSSPPPPPSQSSGAPPAGATPVPNTGPVQAGQEAGPHYTPAPGTKKYKRVGDYDIVSKLGQGAMGSVYLAKQVSSGQMVALKILPPDLAKDQELLERFKRESRASQRFSHPNIVSAVEFGTVEKYHYLAMEYVDGPDLESMLKKNGPFQEELLLRVASDICAALEEIERHKIVHRDIKPSNIMMTSTGIFRLTDLGLASAGQGDQRLTMAGFAVGTPYYLSPEQARGQLDVDIRADIYGFGATLYHLCTGNVPFPGTNPVVVMTQHISTPLKPPRAVDPAISAHISALIERMMEKDPADRPQSAAQLREAVELCKKGQAPGMKARTTTISVPAEEAESALDRTLSFLPKAARIPVIVGLVLACLALIALIVWMVMKH
ncbi:MAG TPA: serine/threonine-protein kinase [Planctomycetota bacterium]|nr:serine/threonine-protein kinase [Planctomycetota bacterium]